MIIVDSNAWGDYFNGAHEPHVERLERALSQEEDLAILGLIVTEVLQGFRTETGFRRARRVLAALPMIHPTSDCYLRAAGLYRALRRKGITVRGAIDCIIAQTCLDLDALVLSPDADFTRIAEHTALRLCR